MRLRHAVLLTSSKSSHPTQLPSRQHIVRITSLDATLTRIGGRGPQLSSEAVSPSWHSPFPLPPIPFFFIVLRTLLHNGTGATLFQSISYALFSSRRRVYPLTASWISPLDANCHTVRPTLFSSLPRYLLTSFPLGALRVPLATLFPPWLANASANTSLPISTGAKRSRAPFASRRIPPFRSRVTISTAGSKLVQDTVK